MIMRSFFPILKFIVLSLLVGYVSMLVQSDSMENWYPFLQKSALTPPGYVFSLVWGVLYILMGVSAGLVSGAQTSRSPYLILLFFLQLLLNFMWSLCFFYLMMPLLAFVVLLVLLFVLVAYIAGCYRLKKYIAFINIPYVGWLLFAAYLNVYVVLNN